jgi:hypothetical protein
MYDVRLSGHEVEFCYRASAQARVGGLATGAFFLTMLWGAHAYAATPAPSLLLGLAYTVFGAFGLGFLLFGVAGQRRGLRFDAAEATVSRGYGNIVRPYRETVYPFADVTSFGTDIEAQAYRWVHFSLEIELGGRRRVRVGAGCDERLARELDGYLRGLLAGARPERDGSPAYA